MEEFINRAFNHAQDTGTVIVVSAGNTALNLDKDSDGYKAYCQSPHVVCVSATGPTSQVSPIGPWTNIDVDPMASYSNYGAPITVAAPGGNKLTSGGNSLVWAACPRTTLISSLIPSCRPSSWVVGSQGTSMAAPHASGLAALLVENVGKRQPSQVAAQIRKWADDLGNPGKDAFYGHGRINVANALGLQ